MEGVHLLERLCSGQVTVVSSEFTHGVAVTADYCMRYYTLYIPTPITFIYIYIYIYIYTRIYDTFHDIM